MGDFHLLKALVGVDVVQPLQLVVVQHQGGRVQDQLGRGAAELLQVGPGQVQRVGVRPGALHSFLARHLADLETQEVLMIILSSKLGGQLSLRQERRSLYALFSIVN